MIERPWRTAIISDESTGDHSKDLRVPNDRYYHVYAVRLEYLTASTGSTTFGVGSSAARQMVLQVLDADSDIIWEFLPGVTQAEATTRFYSLAPGNPDLTAVRDTDRIISPLPPSLILPPAYTFRVFDQNYGTGADTAGGSTVTSNDLQVHVMVGVAPGQRAGSGTG